MPIDDLEFSPEMSVDPLDVSSFGGSPSPLAQPQKSAKPNFADYGPLLALLPIVAQRGGMGGIAALMKGLSDARMQKQQQGRLASQDEQRLGQLRGQDEARRATADNQAAQRKQQFMGQFSNALGGVDSPEAVSALLDFYGGQAQDFGMERPALEQFAMQTATPDRLMSRKVSKRWEKMSPSEKEMAQRTQASLQIDGQTIPYQTWAPLIGGMVDPATGAYPQAAAVAPKVDTPTPGSFEEYVGLPTDQQTLRRQQRKEFLQSDDRQPAAQAPKAGETSGLPPAVARRVDSKSKGWDSLPIVKTTQKMAEAVSFANGLDINTKNPADDQALIYAFAKAMDPDSVVREGEYATVQKYAQSWADSFGFNAARIFSNTPFLTPQSRANMKKTITAKFASSRAQYDNVRRSYGAQINRITGQQDGEDYLTDYAGGFPTDQAATPKAAPKIEAGRTYNHPQLGRVRVVGTNPDGTVKVEKVVP